jgi:excisionase family DNA binding protein
MLLLLVKARRTSQLNNEAVVPAASAPQRPPERVPAAAKRLDVDESVIRRAWRNGQIKGTRLGRLILLDPESVDRFDPRQMLVGK